MNTNGLTKSDIFILWQTLNAIPGVESFVVGYAMARTKRFIKDEVEAMQEAIKPSADYLEYDRKRVELCERLSKKDDNGKSIVLGGGYVFDNPQEFQIELAKLDKKHREVLNKREEQIAAFNKAMLESAESKVFMVKASKMPDSLGSFADGLYPMIDYDLSDEDSLIPEQEQEK